MIRACGDADFDAILAVVNDAAAAYRGVIPDDCWSEPYMPAEELAAEIAAGIAFSGYEDTGTGGGGEAGGLLGVMGLQEVGDVLLIRHAYVRAAHQGRGIGARLLTELTAGTAAPILIGTWAAARWAIRFYERHGFRLVPAGEKDGLLARYWSISERQMETSVVLADEHWWAGRREPPATG